ncbi:MAG: hypothetical protein AVDCRST_MAG56-5182 [uncultured Cytophagales bacterium]|uniref:Uncharacterized protein n=1 Tax=uncultured Cytophagales bacterium TaxID=158755 RepID=A0A6J4K5I1_9SPHI|nr:MAG: hypothetical protein AVDCRST_MAG56-5182 [uncultured Cytophagales bacterium]
MFAARPGPLPQRLRLADLTKEGLMDNGEREEMMTKACRMMKEKGAYHYFDIQHSLVIIR